MPWFRKDSAMAATIPPADSGTTIAAAAATAAGHRSSCDTRFPATAYNAAPANALLTVSGTTTTTAATGNAVSLGIPFYQSFGVRCPSQQPSAGRS